MGHERDIVEKGFEQDRLDYWAMRDELLAKYAGKWVAVHKGRVLAVADGASVDYGASTSRRRLRVYE
jgi:hypothetical protein